MGKADEKLEQLKAQYEGVGDHRLGRRLLQNYREDLLPRLKEAALGGDARTLGPQYTGWTASELSELHNGLARWVANMSGIAAPEPIVGAAAEPEPIEAGDLPTVDQPMDEEDPEVEALLAKASPAIRLQYEKGMFGKDDLRREVEHAAAQGAALRRENGLPSADPETEALLSKVSPVIRRQYEKGILSLDDVKARAAIPPTPKPGPQSKPTEIQPNPPGAKEGEIVTDPAAPVRWPDIDTKNGPYKLDPDITKVANAVLASIEASNQQEYFEKLREFLDYSPSSSVGTTHDDIARWFAKKFDKEFPAPVLAAVAEKAGVSPDEFRDTISKAIANKALMLRRQRMEKFGETDNGGKRFPVAVDKLHPLAQQLDSVKRDIQANQNDPVAVQEGINQALKVGFGIHKAFQDVKKERIADIEMQAMQFKHVKDLADANLAKLIGPDGKIRPGADESLVKAALTQKRSVERAMAEKLKPLYDKLQEIKAHTDSAGSFTQQLAELKEIGAALRSELASAPSGDEDVSLTVPGAEKFKKSDNAADLSTKLQGHGEVVAYRYAQMAATAIDRINAHIYSLIQAAAGQGTIKTRADRERDLDRRAKSAEPRFRPNPYEEEDEEPGFPTESLHHGSEVILDGFNEDEAFLNGLRGVVRESTKDYAIVDLAPNVIVEDKAIKVKRGEFVVESLLTLDMIRKLLAAVDAAEKPLAAVDQVGSDTGSEPPTGNKDMLAGLEDKLDASNMFDQAECGEYESPSDPVTHGGDEAVGSAEMDITPETISNMDGLEDAKMGCEACAHEPCLCCEECGDYPCRCEQRTDGFADMIAGYMPEI